MNLPKKDKNGNSYLSYSQIALFKRDLNQYHEQYILNKPFEGNEYTDFGSKVGTALETYNFNGFHNDEIDTLKKVTRLDLFEKKTILNYDGFYVIGFIDSCSSDYSQIIDYKTGGKGKHLEYSKEDYNQLHIYALSICQETGITPTKASVEFILREGNAFRGERLRVANKEPIKIDIDINMNRLNSVYWDVLKTAKEIEKYYETISN